MFPIRTNAEHNPRFTQQAGARRSPHRMPTGRARSLRAGAALVPPQSPTGPCRAVPNGHPWPSSARILADDEASDVTKPSAIGLVQAWPLPFAPQRGHLLTEGHVLQEEACTGPGKSTNGPDDDGDEDDEEPGKGQHGFEILAGDAADLTRSGLAASHRSSRRMSIEEAQPDRAC
jgi:hypothetical protein